MTIKFKRILRIDSFQVLLGTKPFYRSKQLQCFAKVNSNLGPRLGVLVPKRLAKRSIDRNLFKRLVRAAYANWALNQNQDVLVRLIVPISSFSLQDKKKWWLELKQLFENLQSKQ